MATVKEMQLPRSRHALRRRLGYVLAAADLILPGRRYQATSQAAPAIHPSPHDVSVPCLGRDVQRLGRLTES
jgi:hypothetical protein